MSAPNEDLLMSGQLYGKIPGISTRKDWSLFYLEVAAQLHIFEGHEDLSVARKHLRSLVITSTDSVIAEKDKKLFRFTLRRDDGTSYTFKCANENVRKQWIDALARLINKKHFKSLPGFKSSNDDVFGPKRMESPKVPAKAHWAATLPSVSKTSQSALHHPAVPGVCVSGTSGRDSGSSSPNDSGSGSFGARGNVRHSKMSTRSDDSGLGVSDNGQWIRGHHSGGETHHRPTVVTEKKSSSDSGKFEPREELENYVWFWGHMNRAESEAKMKEVGVVGNFAIRINATGCYIMTFWRSDGIHHHKIIHQLGIFRFEKTAVAAEGNSLVDLLDNYMKNCTDKKIVPIGGVLHLVYDEAWNPPEIDMEQLQQKLCAQKRRQDRQKVLADVLQPGQNPRKAGKKEAYTVVSPTSRGAKDSDFTQSMPASEIKQLNKEREQKRFGIDPITPTKQKVLPALPQKAAGETKSGKPLPVPPEKPKPSSPHLVVETSKHDKRHNPLPPTPDESPTEKTSPSPKQKQVPTPTPRNARPLKKNTTLPTTPPPEKPHINSPASTTSLSPPPQEQASYVNAPHRKTRKSPVPTPGITKPHPSGNSTPSSSAQHESDPGGQEIYENTNFGDSVDDETFYGNLPLNDQRQRQRQHNGHAHTPSSYQNIAFDTADSGGSMYQNIEYPGRGNKRKH